MSGEANTKTLLGAAVCLMLALLALPAGASAKAPAGSVVISNETTLTHWGTTMHRGAVRTAPRLHARRITRLHFMTEDGFPEVYVVLRRYRDSKGRGWFLIRLPMRPNGRTGWVRSWALGELNVVHTRLVLDRPHLRATLFKNGRRIWSSPVGIGRPSLPTPGGHFWIREKFPVHSPGSLYGPWAFGTAAYSRLTDWPGGGVVGIHGTNEPRLIPGRPSHGCVRVPNGRVVKLAHLMPVGTPLLIR
jgi:hypothetical protein